MSVLNRKTRRDVMSMRVALAAILLVTVVGMSTFVGMASVYVNLDGARRDYYARCRMADFWVTLKKAPLAEVERVREIPGVAEVRPRITFQASVDIENVPKPLNGVIISLPETGDNLINGIVPVRGSGFSADRLEEVIVNDAFARARRIHPGQTIHVILNDRRQALFVVGTAMSSEFVYLLSPGGLTPDPESYGVFYVKQRFAEEVLDFDGACNEMVGLLTHEARDNPRPVLDEIETLLEPYGVFATVPRSEQASHQILMGELIQLRAMSVILPAVFLGVAVLVLNILMSRVAEQQRTIVGTLKALGYGNGALLRHYLRLGLLVGAAGGTLGAVAGWGLAQGTTVMYRAWFELPRLDNRIVPWVYGAAIVLAVGFALVGTVRGVRVVLRLDPAEAMRPRPPVVAGAIWPERVPALRRLWSRLGFRWQMAARSIWRHRLRSAAGVFAAAMGGALMFTTLYFADSVEYLLEFAFDKVLVSDLDVTFQREVDDGALLEVKRLPGVDHAEPLLFVACDFENGHRRKKSGITGVRRGARLTVPRTADGRRVEVPESGLLMDRRLADTLGVGSGDEITIVPVKGLRERARVDVARIVDGFLGLATYADYDWLNGVVGEASAVSGAQLEARSDLASRLALYAALKELPTIQALVDNGEAKQKLVTMLLDVMRWSVAVELAMAGAIFFGSILTTSLIALSERRREVATLAVIGYDLHQVGGIFLRESLVVNVCGAAIGLPLGLWLCHALIETNTRDVFRLPNVTGPGPWVWTVALAILFAVLAHSLVQRAINRLNWLEALNAKE